MKVLRRLLIMVLFSLVHVGSHGYVRNRSDGNTGAPLAWPSGSTNIVLNVDSGGRTYLDVSTNVGDAILEWNASSGVTLSQQASSTQAEDQNDVYFPVGGERDEVGFGSSTLAVTLTRYYIGSGTIIEGDILYNTDFFDGSEDESKFADVTAHEMGHLIGLSHSEVKGATMLYTHFDGQATLSDDDKAGGYAAYPYSPAKGQISGKIIGGAGRVPIFGTHVQAISEETGTVVAGAISDDDGTFAIKGLELDDTYYLYTRPIQVIASIPSYYSNIKKDFCSGGADYRGSFFQSCLASDSGQLQGIKISGTQASRNVGSVTIRCNLRLPSSYSDAKGGGTFSPATQDASDNVGNTLVGYFTRAQFDAGSSDSYSLDLGTFTAQANEYLEVKVIAQGLYSVLDFDVDATPSGTSTSPTGSSLDKIVRVPLTQGVSGEEIDVEITPENYGTHMNDGGTPSDFTDDTCKTTANYPNCNRFGDDLHLYLLSFRVVESDSGGYSSVSQKSFPTIYGNDSCPDAANAYAVTRSSSGGSSQPTRVQPQEDELLVGCGSLDASAGPPGSGGGPLSLFAGFLIAALLSSSRKRAEERAT